MSTDPVRSRWFRWHLSSLLFAALFASLFMHLFFTERGAPVGAEEIANDGAFTYGRGWPCRIESYTAELFADETRLEFLTGSRSSAARYDFLAELNSAARDEGHGNPWRYAPERGIECVHAETYQFSRDGLIADIAAFLISLGVVLTFCEFVARQRKRGRDAGGTPAPQSAGGTPAPQSSAGAAPAPQ